MPRRYGWWHETYSGRSFNNCSILLILTPTDLHYYWETWFIYRSDYIGRTQSQRFYEVPPNCSTTRTPFTAIALTIFIMLVFPPVRYWRVTCIVPFLRVIQVPEIVLSYVCVPFEHPQSESRNANVQKSRNTKRNLRMAEENGRKIVRGGRGEHELGQNRN